MSYTVKQVLEGEGRRISKVICHAGYYIEFAEQNGMGKEIVPILSNIKGEELDFPEFITYDELRKTYTQAIEENNPEERSVIEHLTPVLTQFKAINDYLGWNPRRGYADINSISPIFRDREEIKLRLSLLIQHDVPNVFFNELLVPIEISVANRELLETGWDDREHPLITTSAITKFEVHTIEDNWSSMSGFFVSSFIENSSVGLRNGSCRAWRTGGQQLFGRASHEETEGLWELKFIIIEGKIAQIDISGAIDKEWIQSVQKSLKAIEYTPLDHIREIQRENGDINIDINLQRVGEQLKRSTRLECTILEQYLNIIGTRYGIPIQNHPFAFDGWSIHHNRGTQMQSALTPRFKEVRRSVMYESNSEGSLLPVLPFWRWTTIFFILLATVAVFLGVAFTGPPKECQKEGCHKWVRTDAILWALGFLLSLVTASELLFGSEKGIGALCRGRIRLLGSRPIALWCGVSKTQMISILWQTVDTESGQKTVLDPDMDGNGILHLIMRSVDDYDLNEGADWQNVAYTFSLGGVRYSDVRHLCYIDEAGFSVSNSQWSPVTYKDGEYRIEAKKDAPMRTIVLSKEANPRSKIF